VHRSWWLIYSQFMMHSQKKHATCSLFTIMTDVSKYEEGTNCTYNVVPRHIWTLLTWLYHTIDCHHTFHYCCCCFTVVEVYNCTYNTEWVTIIKVCCHVLQPNGKISRECSTCHSELKCPIKYSSFQNLYQVTS